MTDPRIAVMTRHGLDNAADIHAAAEVTGVPLRYAAALFEKESGGRNIYGHDWGGALSTVGQSVTVCGVKYPLGSDIPVTAANFGIFLIQLYNGRISNGVGPGQITYAGELPDGRSGGYFRLMLEDGLLPWVPLDNMTFALRELKARFDTSQRWREAGARYNGGSRPGARAYEYADDLVAKARVWRKRFEEEA